MNAPDGGRCLEGAFFDRQNWNHRLQARNHPHHRLVGFDAGRQHQARDFGVIDRQVGLHRPDDDIAPVAGRDNQDVFLDVIEEIGEHHRAGHEMINLISQLVFAHQHPRSQRVADFGKGGALQGFFPRDHGQQEVRGQLHSEQFAHIVHLLRGHPVGHQTQYLHVAGFKSLKGRQSRADNLGG